MSTISSGMNASATVFSIDIYKKYFNKKELSNKQYMRLLYVSTALFGSIGLIAGIAMIGSKSILDVWWELSGIFAGGMLGLFLLGLISRQTKNAEAITAVLAGIIVILWMTFGKKIGVEYNWFKNTLHNNMIIVVGTLTIFLVGLIVARLRKKEISRE
jgi:solute:Na+ symporter, SSS family